MEEKKLVGFKKFTGKNGKNYCVANVLSNYSQYDRGCVGQKVEEIFLPEGCEDMLNEKTIGKAVNIGYRISAGRAYVESFSIVEGGNK